MLEIKSFHKEYENMFEEYLDDVKRILRKKNQKYINLQEKYHKILDENENLVWILEGQTENRNLSNKECTALSKLVEIYYDMYFHTLLILNHYSTEHFETITI